MKHTLLLLMISCFTLISCTDQEQKMKNEAPEIPPINLDELTVEELFELDSHEEAELVFGEENVVTDTGELPEDLGTYLFTKVYPDSEKEIILRWLDDTLNLSGLESVNIQQKESPWKNKCKLKVGMKMSELEKLNEKPFEFYGLAWDHGGLTFWEGGELDGTGYTVYLDWPEDFYVTDDHYPIMGEKRISSTDSLALTIDPEVKEIFWVKLMEKKK